MSKKFLVTFGENGEMMIEVPAWSNIVQENDYAITVNSIKITINEKIISMDEYESK